MFFSFFTNLDRGRNGQGKTNLLEALVFLAYGRSFRAQLPESLVQEGRSSTYVSAEVVKENKYSLLQFCLEKSGTKQFWINEKKNTNSSIFKELPLITFSVESLILLKGSTEHRRW